MGYYSPVLLSFCRFYILIYFIMSIVCDFYNITFSNSTNNTNNTNNTNYTNMNNLIIKLDWSVFGKFGLRLEKSTCEKAIKMRNKIISLAKKRFLVDKYEKLSNYFNYYMCPTLELYRETFELEPNDSNYMNESEYFEKFFEDSDEYERYEKYCDYNNECECEYNDYDYDDRSDYSWDDNCEFSPDPEYYRALDKIMDDYDFRIEHGFSPRH